MVEAETAVMVETQAMLMAEKAVTAETAETLKAQSRTK